jgi:hypothetical protein
MEMNNNASVTADTFNRFTVGFEPASCTPQDVSDAQAGDGLLTENQIVHMRQSRAGSSRQADAIELVCSHKDNQI